VDRGLGAPQMTRWAPLWCLALAWGLLPALPALLRGELLGHGLTDLYPAVWGLWTAAQAWPALATEAPLLGAPEGLPWIYQSPLRGWVAGPLLPLLGLRWTWNLLLLAARVGTVLAAGAAGAAFGLRRAGQLTVAAAFGCAPFFHGYAVEGIIEGADGWCLGLLLVALGRGRAGWAAVALGICVWCSFYAGAAGCALVGVLGLSRPRRWLAFAGLLLGLPLVLAFAQAFPDGAPLEPAVRRAMGVQPLLARPGAAPGLQPFAMTTWIGPSLALAALAGRGATLPLALAPLVLSVGDGPWDALPGFAQLRFPYRWHAATLALLALSAGAWADRRRWRGLLAPIIVVEGLLLSPIEPVIPGADPGPPAPCALLAAHAAGGGAAVEDGALLVIPGPVALPPGRPNPSRGRSREVLFAQTCHGRPTPAVPDFNSVGVRRTAPALSPLLAYDRVAGGRGGPLAPGAVAGLQALGVRAVVLMRDDPGLTDEEDLRQGLLAQGARRVGGLEPAPRSPELWALPGPPARPAQEDVQQPIR
jgi:hypothetical protein